MSTTMKVNLLCDKYKIERKNPTINIELNEIQQEVPKIKKTSQYKGVGWYHNRWFAKLYLNGTKTYGGRFKDELDAAKRVNQLCEKFKIPLQNPEISAKPTHPYEDTISNIRYQSKEENIVKIEEE